MKQICLVGPIDKRIVVYPLLKVADLVGKMLVITDDANFRRFAETFEKEFNLGNSDYIVVNDISEETIVNKEVKLHNYDFVVYVTTNYIVKEADKIIYCHGLSKTVLPEKDLDILEGLEYVEVVITQGRVEDKKLIHVGVDKITMGYVWGCEENKCFVPLKDINMSKIASHLFADFIGVSKDDFCKLLVREEG